MEHFKKTGQEVSQLSPIDRVIFIAVKFDEKFGNFHAETSFIVLPSCHLGQQRFKFTDFEVFWL